ncbi:myogenesis-regulating glycosidase [Diabrotica virgifera virgifera]|uniref:Myogenesis-regulating glycosidase n=1 Tax=Diabrotica virgifera virgifera TaxID=50390 RepID=A0ABM5L660_DIAVI|nr:myogenesis-regulating glycosidase [Diabrotica virgifera virgifera]XP_050517921.1 myogenesis-regulating glycosidase [Diabrotica virgifera virgifera]XP_050517922.1 myogenesis-regulating glycosidase [Diabrotica virgifera virgifera]XP_050517923.1 myogenesis-regulating glycosidase [Diabrotica virgifera virgifera]
MDRKKYRNATKYNKVPQEIPKIVLAAPSTENLSLLDSEMDSKSRNDNNSSPDKTDDVIQRDTVRPPMRRKNSISMPNLDDLKVFIEQEGDGYDTSTEKINTTIQEEPEDPEFQNISSYPRSVRRKSVLSPRMLKPPEDTELGGSPSNSITSVNSIASLLKEKIQNLPQTFRKKKSPEYKTKVFVGFLFTTIIVLIVTAYFLYQQKVLAKVYFGNMKLNKAKRTVKIFNDEGEDVVKLHLGTTLNYDNVLNCLPADNRDDGSLCLEWMHRARLYMNFFDLGSDVKCYNVQWIALSESLAPTDCFDMSHSHWYGGGQTAENAWPLEKGSHFYQPFITGNIETHEWGNVLKRYFINSKGAAIVVDNETPLYISIRDSPKKEFCLRAQYDNFAFVNKFTSTAQLNYSICTSANMSQLHVFLSEHTLWDGLKKEDSNIIDYFLTEPVWEMPDMKEALTQDVIDNVTTKITNSVAVLKQGHILINEFWQEQIGDFELDQSRFPDFDKLIEKLKRRGFRVVFTIQPFISTESFNFAEVVRKKLLVSERFSDKRIPALTRYKSLQSAGVLDITNVQTISWLLHKLKKVMNTYKIDSFYLDIGVAYNMPHYYQCEKALLNPDEYKTIFTNNLQGEVPLFGVNSAIERPRSPSFVVLPEFEFSWDGLRKIIPTILTYGILGYPFLIPGAVGGDYAVPETMLVTNGTENVLADPELYIRWLQLATFLPVVRYRHLPNSYSQNNIAGLAKELAKKRHESITPKLKKFARVSLNLGLPIIRPLWMLDSDDPACHLAVDEFSIGDEIIVAPVLHSGAREREIYLPAGVWKDGIDGSLRKGSRWIHDYRVEEDNVAYFERMPDDTRF